MKTMLLAFVVIGLSLSTVDRVVLSAEPPTSPDLILLMGVPGTEEYAKVFKDQAALWRKTAQQGDKDVLTIGQSSQSSPKDELQSVLASMHAPTNRPLWLVMIGHGTYDSKQARFNLPGPDITARELSDWLKPVKRPTVIVDGAAASSPFLSLLSSTNRIIVTATRSGFQNSYAYFGMHLAQSLQDEDADLDKDGRVSLLEAFLKASRNVSAFYENEGRIRTEHALLDDNGDKKGIQAELFRGVRPSREKMQKGEPDGYRAHQIHLVPNATEARLNPDQIRERDRLEMDVYRLREKRSDVDEATYYAKMETLLLKLGAFLLEQEE